MPDRAKERSRRGLTIATEDGTRGSFLRKADRGETYPFYKPEFRSIFLLAISYFGLLLVGAVLAYWQRYLLQVSANRIVRRMRNDVSGISNACRCNTSIICRRVKSSPG